MRLMKNCHILIFPEEINVITMKHSSSRREWATIPFSKYQTPMKMITMIYLLGKELKDKYVGIRVLLLHGNSFNEAVIKKQKQTADVPT